MADAQSKNGVPAVPLVNETRRDRRHSLPVLARPSEDCVLARSSRGDIRLLVHHAASPGDRSPSNTSCSLDEQGSFLLPSVATEAESRCRLIKQMSGTLAFTLVAAFALLTAIFVLAGRAHWRHSILPTHCLLELHAAIVLLFLIIGPAAALLWNLCTDDGAIPLSSKGQVRVTSTVIAFFEISAALALIFVVVHIQYLPPLSSFKMTAVKRVERPIASKAAFRQPASFVSLVPPHFRRAQRADKGAAVEMKWGATPYAGGTASEDVLGLESYFSPSEVPVVANIQTGSNDDKQEWSRRNNPELSALMQRLLQLYRAQFRRQRLSSSPQKRGTRKELIASLSHPLWKYAASASPGKGGSPPEANPETTESVVSGSLWHPGDGISFSEAARTYNDTRRSAAFAHNTRVVSGSPGMEQNSVEDSASISTAEASSPMRASADPIHPATGLDHILEVSRDAASRSWLLALRTITFIGTVSCVVFLITSGMLTTINRSLQSAAAEQFLTCSYLAALAGFLAAVLSLLDLAREPGPMHRDYKRLPLGEIAPAVLATYLIVDGVTNIIIAWTDEQATGKGEQEERIAAPAIGQALGSGDS